MPIIITMDTFIPGHGQSIDFGNGLYAETPDGLRFEYTSPAISEEPFALDSYKELPAFETLKESIGRAFWFAKMFRDGIDAAGLDKRTERPEDDAVMEVITDYPDGQVICRVTDAGSICEDTRPNYRREEADTALDDWIQKTIGRFASGEDVHKVENEAFDELGEMIESGTVNFENIEEALKFFREHF